jgi:hypothetical protein
MVTPFMVAFLYSNYAITGVIGLCVGSLCAAFVAVYIWGIETRGKTLEQLEGTEPNPASPTDVAVA